MPRERVGVASFTLEGLRRQDLARRLSDEFAIGVRHGCFCAHPLLTRLLRVPEDEAQWLQPELKAGREPELPGAVRASIGLGTTVADSTPSRARSTSSAAALIACQTRCGVAGMSMFDPEGCERVDDGVPDGGRGADRARLADALGAERVARRRGLRALGLERRQVARGRDRVGRQRAGDVVAVLVVGDLLEERLRDALGDAAVDLALDAAAGCGSGPSRRP